MDLHAGGSLALTGLVLAELFIANLGVNTDSVGLSQQAALSPAAQMVQAAVAETAATAQPIAGLPGRVANEHRVFEDYGMRAGVEDIWGSSPLRLARLDALLEDFPSDRRWRLLGVQHVVSEQPELFVPSAPPVELPGAGKPSYLHRLEQPNPRAWVVSTVQSLDDDEALPWLADTRLDLENTALLPPVTDGAGRAGAMADGFLALPGASSVSLQRLAPNRLRADVQSEHGGLLVVSENWLPGWHATVQPAGATSVQQAPVVRADVALLGVPIGAGQSTVDLEYRPSSVRYGIIISIASLFLLGLGALLVWLRR